VEEELRRAFAVTRDPAAAHFFYVPACLSQHWASGWQWNPNAKEGTAKLTACVNCTALHEQQLLAAMRRVGRWYDEKPHAHLLTRHRCPRVGEAAFEIGAGAPVYRTLWHHSRARYVCLETDPNPPPGSVRDLAREVHIPYYTSVATMAPPPKKNVRPRLKSADFAFVGSFCCRREWVKVRGGAGRGGAGEPARRP
jgi:hypothetical protein